MNQFPFPFPFIIIITSKTKNIIIGKRKLMMFLQKKKDQTYTLLFLNILFILDIPLSILIYDEDDHIIIYM